MKDKKNTFFRLLQEPVFLAGAGGVILYANGAAMELFGERLVKEGVRHLLHTPLFLYGGVGAVTLLDCNVTAHVTRKGKLHLVLILSEGFVTQEEGTMLAAAARQLGELLGVQSAALDSLEQGLREDIPPWAAMSVARLRRTVTLLTRLSHGLGLISLGARLEELAAWAKFDLVLLIRETLRMADALMPRQEARIRYKGVLEEMIFIGDAVLMEQLLLELLNNALRFSPDKSEVSVRLWRRWGMVYMQVQNKTVEENPPEPGELFHPQPGEGPIPEPESGAGLGLTLVRQIAALHGGGVAVNIGSRTASVVVSLRSGSPEKCLRNDREPEPWQDEALVRTALANLLPVEAFLTTREPTVLPVKREREQ